MAALSTHVVRGKDSVFSQLALNTEEVALQVGDGVVNVVQGGAADGFNGSPVERGIRIFGGYVLSRVGKGERGGQQLQVSQLDKRRRQDHRKRTGVVVAIGSIAHLNESRLILDVGIEEAKTATNRGLILTDQFAQGAGCVGRIDEAEARGEMVVFDGGQRSCDSRITGDQMAQ